MQVRTRIKFCGITRVEDAREAVRLGVDAIGLVFAARSPRCLTIEAATRIARAVPPFVSAVALFVDADPAFVSEVLRTVRPTALQFHGSETQPYCSQFRVPYIKAVPMGDGSDPQAYMARYDDAWGFLLDSHAPGGQGGTGRAFDWSRFPGQAAPALILAGGLTPSNVGAAVCTLRPFAIDVSSGVESGPGIKDHAKMRDFVDEVQRAGG